MDSSESLHLDEHLARLLAAYDHGLDEADHRAPTIDVRPLLEGERLVEPLSGSDIHHGSMNDLLPDASRGDPFKVVASPTPEIHRVGRFELRKQLGRGGCGIVFLAHDPKLKRDVALKIPRPELLMSPDARKRLVREATAAAGFDHPNLVPVYETGEIGPVCFIATVFCPGITLAEWLDRQAFPVPIRQAARLVAQLAEAVQHAHDRGVLHRDLKPNNVILQDVKVDADQQDAPPGACPLRGDYYIPRVVDFGLAKLADSGPGETATRQVLGTPKYMAPEQAQARHEDVGPEADVYALGGILFELLTGRAPYEGETDVDVLRQCIEGNLTPPRHLRKDIPRDLEAICIKAMSRTPTRRYRSSLDFADDLRRFLDGRPTLARPLNGLGRASRWLRRNDQLFALVTVTTISVILLASGAWNAYQTQKLQVSSNESALREHERARQDYSREYVRSLREGFHAWETGQRETLARSLVTSDSAIRWVSSEPEFSRGYLLSLGRQSRVPASDTPPHTRAIAVSPDGMWIVAGYADGLIRTWKREHFQPVGTTQITGAAIEKIEYLERDRFQVSAAGQVHTLQLTQAGAAVKATLDPARRLAPGELNAVSSLEGGVDLKTAAGQIVRSLRGAGGTLRSVRLNADRRIVAAVTDDRSLAIWELDSDSFHVHRGFESELFDLAFAPDGHTLYLAASDGIHIQDACVDPAGPSLRERSASVATVAIRPGSLEHVVGYSDGRVDCFAAPGVLTKSHPPRERGLTVLRYLENGTVLGVEVREDHVFVWQFGETVKLTLRKSVRASAVDLSPVGESLAVADSGGLVKVWSVANGELLGNIETKGTSPPGCLSFSESGRWLAMPVEGTRLGFWFVGEPNITIKVAGHPEGTALFRFIGEDRVASVGKANTIKLWSLTNAGEETNLIGHTARITSLAASSDQRTLASGAADGSTKLWDLRTGSEILSLTRHRGPVRAAEFAPNGAMLITGSSFRGRGELAFWESAKQ